VAEPYSVVPVDGDPFGGGPPPMDEASLGLTIDQQSHPAAPSDGLTATQRTLGAMTEGARQGFGVGPAANTGMERVLHMFPGLAAMGVATPWHPAAKLLDAESPGDPLSRGFGALTSGVTAGISQGLQEVGVSRTHAEQLRRDFNLAATDASHVSSGVPRPRDVPLQGEIIPPSRVEPVAPAPRVPPTIEGQVVDSPRIAAPQLQEPAPTTSYAVPVKGDPFALPGGQSDATAQAAASAAQQAAAAAERDTALRLQGQGGVGERRGGDGIAEETGRAASAAGARAPLAGLPSKALRIGDQVYVPGPIDRAHQAAEAYMQEVGLPYDPPKTYAKVDPDRARLIAKTYDELPNAPDDPAVQASYQAMINETLGQFRHILDTGLQIEFIKPGQSDPYHLSPRLAKMDVRDNNHLWVYPTDQGFGSEGLDRTGTTDLSPHPMLQPTAYVVDGRPLVANDVFRIVHDYFGHIKDGNGFRAAGEENAWRSHAAMYSPLARPAMTAETRGQNSWVNYGPHGDKNFSAKSGDTVYAEQKAAIMPQWVVDDGRFDAPDVLHQPMSPDELGGVKINDRFYDLGPWQNDLSQPAGGQAQKYILQRGRETGLEHLLAFDQHGDQIAHGYGLPNRVQFPRELSVALRTPGQAVVTHHNHPSGAGPSGPDTAILVLPGMAASWMHGHNGVSYRTALTTAAREALRGGDFEIQKSRLRRIFDAVDEAVARPLRRAIEAGKVDSPTATQLNAYLTNETLRQAGIIDFHTTYDPGHWLDTLKLRSYLPFWEMAVRDHPTFRSQPGGLFNGPSGLSDRAAFEAGPRSRGEVGTVFGGAEGSPALARDLAADRGSPGDDRRPGAGRRGTGGGATRPDELADRESDGRISTRIPYLLGADPTVHSRDDLVVGLDSAREAEKAYAKNAGLVKLYPGLQLGRVRSPDAVMQKLIEHAHDNLLALHDAMPEAWRQRAKLWYEGANAIANRWANEFGLNVRSTAGALASLSPQKDWFQNVSLAHRVIDIVHNQADGLLTTPMRKYAKRLIAQQGEGPAADVLRSLVTRFERTPLSQLTDPIEQAMWVRWFDEAHNSPSYPVVTPEGGFAGPMITSKGEQWKVVWPPFPNIAKALSVIRDPSIENISKMMGSNHKVRNFYNNIIAPNAQHGDVTIDTHAVAAALLRPLAGSDPEVMHGLGLTGGKSAHNGNKGLYGIYADAYRGAAAARGILPREMQSITWEAIRGLFTTGQKKGGAALPSKVSEIWDEYAKGRISRAEARERVFAAAGGIKAPEWVGPASGVDVQARSAGDQGRLHQAGIPAPAAPLDSGARGRAARAPSGFQEEPLSLAGLLEPQR
jgi:hypothetical protein